MSKKQLTTVDGKAIRPIILGAPMIKPTLYGLKTKNRRPLKTNCNLLQPAFKFNGVSRIGDPMNGYVTLASFRWLGDPHNSESHLVKCPYGLVGDILWVKETLYYDNHSGDEWCYQVDDKPVTSDFQGVLDTKINGYIRSVDMPYTACRIWLEITSIQVERLQEITEADAIAEGVEQVHVAIVGLPPEQRWQVRYHDYGRYASDHPKARLLHSPVHSYKNLHKRLHGKDVWQNNPYVWVIGFKRICKPAIHPH